MSVTRSEPLSAAKSATTGESLALSAATSCAATTPGTNRAPMTNTAINLARIVSPFVAYQYRRTNGYEFDGLGRESSLARTSFGSLIASRLLLALGGFRRQRADPVVRLVEPRYQF
jgi:hypothetical protein